MLFGFSPTPDNASERQSLSNQLGAKLDPTSTSDLSLLGAIWEALPDPVVVVEIATGQIVAANSAARHIENPDPNAQPSTTPLQNLFPDTFLAELTILKADSLRPISRILRIRRQRFKVQISPFQLGTQAFALLTLQSLRDAKKLSAQYRDPLTGLPDRRAFDRRIRKCFRQAQFQPDARFAVLFVDLDRFKPVNDAHGHPIGDQVLRAVARRLRQCVRPTDMVARRGGDEFTILLSSVSDENTARQVADRILHRLEEPLLVAGRVLDVSVSLGISLFSDDHGHPEELVADADVSMYHVKRAGGKGYAYGFTRHDPLPRLAEEK